MADTRTSRRAATDEVRDMASGRLTAICETLLEVTPLSEFDLATLLKDLADWYGHSRVDLTLEACDEPLLVKQLHHLAERYGKGGAR